MLTHKNVLIVSAILGGLIFLGNMYVNLSLWWLLLPVILYIASTSYGSASIRAGFYVKTHNRVDIDLKQIALSFDDGPVEPYTSEVLDILKAEGVYATFFCIGQQIEKHPELTQRIITEGHTLGNHTYSHSYKMGFFPSIKVQDEIRQTDRLLLKEVNKVPKWFRPPFGVTNPMIAHALKRTEHQVIGWSIRSLDTVIRDEQKTVERIEKQLHPGAVVLLHDRLPEAGKILKRLLAVLKENGYEVVKMEKLLNLAPYDD